MSVTEWLKSLEKFEVLIYRRPNFLAEEFEFESYMGMAELQNIFHKQVVDTTKESIFMSFPERWLNCVECHQLFPRLQKFYPSLKKLTIKTHSPLIITSTPNGHAYLLQSEDKIVEESRGAGSIDAPSSMDDTEAVFAGLSQGKLFNNAKAIT